MTSDNRFDALRAATVTPGKVRRWVAELVRIDRASKDTIIAAGEDIKRARGKGSRVAARLTSCDEGEIVGRSAEGAPIVIVRVVGAATELASLINDALEAIVGCDL